MCYAQGSDLAIAGFVAIEKKPIGDPSYERARAMLLSSTTGILRISETFGNSAFNVEIGPFEGSWLCYKRTGVEPPARMLSGLAQCFPLATPVHH